MTYSKNQANVYSYHIPMKSSTIALPHPTAATLELSSVPLMTEQLQDL
jgi:hypothetical protein